MRAWGAQPLPLGRECLFELDAATDPRYEPEHFIALPGAMDAIDAALDGTMTAGACVERLRAGVNRYRAGERVAFED